MRENFKMLVRWWKFTKPNKLYFVLSFMSGILFRILFYVVQPIFAAKIITSLTENDYKMAMIYLAVGTAVFILSYCIHHIKYVMHDKLMASTYIPFQEMICRKIFLADDANFKNNSKDRLLNISYQDAWDTANYADILTTRIGQFGQVIAVFISVAITIKNVYVILILLGMIVINSFIISFLQTKYAEGTRKIREGVDKSYHTMSNMLDSRPYLHSQEEIKKVQNEHIKANVDMLHEFRRRQTWSSANDNGYGIWCKVFIFAVTLLMIILVSHGMSLEMYLIVVPYITTVVDASNEVLAGFRDLKNTIVGMNRLQVIQNFTERDIVRFGNNSVDDVLGQIDFIDIDYAPNKTNLVALHDINFHVRDFETTVIYGQRNCGKRTIFQLLLRGVEQKKGSIYIDGLSIQDYSNKSYFKNFCFTTNKPYFVEGTIRQQFKVAKAKKDDMEQACKLAGIYDAIVELKNGFDSQVDELNTLDRFLLGLAKALATKANTVAVYELPSVDGDSKKRLQEIFNGLRGKRTIIIFTGQQDFIELGDKVVEIEKGEVKSIQFVDKNESLL
ncbi:MAG: ABC transporter ATP-binding protein [Clostridia bacterium]|nr:ABC transporter ATP-binding protein [Clostridia bacterium]